MNNIIPLGDKRSRSIAENYTELHQQSRARFLMLNAFKGQNFESDKWRYLGETMYFSTMQENKSTQRLEWPDEIKEAIKYFVVAHLWETRTRTKALSASRMIPLCYVGQYLVDTGMLKLEELTGTLYLSAFNAIFDKYKRPQSNLQDLNSFVDFLQNERLLSTKIDKISPAKNKAVQDKQGLPALKEKMPIPELVRAVVQLKWAVEEQFDGTDRAVSDLESVYTQAFQYGLGLRIGEVLCLPVDCLQEVNGELFCKVWTEKGMIPHSRYVPVVWRQVLSDIVQRTLQITSSYRSNAKELEDTKSLSLVRERLETFKENRQSDANELIAELNAFLLTKKAEAEKAWALKKVVDPKREYELIELAKILPISSTSKTPAMMIKAYSSWGIELDSQPIDKRRNRYYVRGKSILDFINLHITQRANNLTEQELLSVIHGRQIYREISGDKSISSLSKTGEGGTAACYTFAPDAFRGKGRAPALIKREDAITKLTEYAHGSYNIEKEIDFLTFRDIFPELVLLTTNSQEPDFKKLNQDFEISDKRKITVKVKSDSSHIRYSVNEGFTISQKSIRKTSR